MSPMNVVERSVLLERYDLRDQLGKGSYGTVFKAIDTHTSEVVAVKIISLGASEQSGCAEIQREIQMLQVRVTMP